MNLNFLPGLIFAALIFLTSCSGKAPQSFSDSESIVGFKESDSISVKVAEPEPHKGIPEYLKGDPEEMLEAMRNSGNWDLYSEGILPRMAKDVPAYCKKLLKNEHPGFIVVDKARMKVILFDKYGRQEKIYGMACAKNYGTKHKKADSRTPEGFFSVEGVYDSTDWLFTDDNGVTSKKKGQFGPRFIRLSIPTTSQIGIHGTCAPWSIGARASHGCIRITNENILELVELVEPGMPVIVSPGSKDMKVNLDEGYDIPAISTSGTWRAVPSKVSPNPVDQTKSDSVVNVQQIDSLKVIPVVLPDSIPVP